MAGSRSYEDPCGIARALDRIGERWALLVVRELILGPKRFTDLRTGLPSVSPNVLSQRLRELESSGVVERRTLPPPANVTAYELTPWGRELEPVILALARWGSRATPLPLGELSLDALLIALEVTFDPAAAGDLSTCVELRLGDERIRAEVAEGRLAVTRGPGGDGCDAFIAADVPCLRQVAFGMRSLAQALREGDLVIGGDEVTAARFLTLFRRPAPVALPSKAPDSP